MKIAIHKHSGSFSDMWIKYCIDNDINYKLVNCYNSDIVKDLADCDGLMWHWFQWDCKAVLFARQLTCSLEHIGFKVFPDSKTSWHFDDKLGQKYLFETIHAPLVPSRVFYEKRGAKIWAKQTSYPKIFKLRGGAASVNVKLIRNKWQAIRLINQAFGRGFRVLDKANSFKNRLLKLRRTKNLANIIHLLKGLVRLVVPKHEEKMRVREKGYIYFQDFIPGKDHDIRVVIIGKRALAIKRMVRKNDFRASGSGNVVFSKDEIPIENIESAFYWAEKLQTQCIGFDFLNENKKLLILEISYSFFQQVFYSCPGFWDRELIWHPGNFHPEEFMIEDFIQTLV